MTDRETRRRILTDPTLPIHTKHNGMSTCKDVLEMYLMGYGTSEIVVELGTPKSCINAVTKRLRDNLGYSSTKEMIRGLVRKQRGYL